MHRVVVRLMALFEAVDRSRKPVRGPPEMPGSVVTAFGAPGFPMHVFRQESSGATLPIGRLPGGSHAGSVC
jgi:hypothetical protein